MENTKKLYRSKKDRMLLGVCGGLGDYFNVDPIIFRIIFVLLVLTNGLGILLYFVLVLIIPIDPSEGGATASSDRIREFANEVGGRARELGSDLKSDRVTSTRNVIGLIVVAVGFLLLLRELSPVYFRWFNWNVIWSAVIIAFGVYLLLRNNKK